MKYVDEFRNPRTVAYCADAIRRTVTRPWTIMEVCGGQTHSIVRNGIDRLLPQEVALIHGPGCPVCVTPIGIIDAAIELAITRDMTLCTFGDMVRVPGSRRDLLDAKAAGAQVQIVYSPLDAVRLASEHPDRQFVFFAVGFETTAPATAIAVLQAEALELTNFSIICAHVLVPPAIEAILASPNCKVQGFLAAGHVCTVMGWREYEDIAADYRVPIIVTGFEASDILQGILMCVRQLERGTSLVENQYARSVHRTGNMAAQKAMERVFERVDGNWRGIGQIPASGLRLAPSYCGFDALTKFGVPVRDTGDAGRCRAGDVLRGELKPNECPLFGKECTPDAPAGAPMVSGEGACAAYYRYGRDARASASLSPGELS